MTDLQKVEEAFDIMGTDYAVYEWTDYNSHTRLGFAIRYGGYYCECDYFDNEAHFNLDGEFVEIIKLQ